MPSKTNSYNGSLNDFKISPKLKKYNGELDHIDPVKLGREIRKNGGVLNNLSEIPSEQYIGQNDEDRDFLFNWHESVFKGWRLERDDNREILYKEALSEFKKVAPSIGDTLYLEHPNNLGKHFKCMIEFVSPEKDAILVRYIDKEKSRFFNDSKYSLIKASYVSKVDRDVFPIFRKVKPY